MNVLESEERFLYCSGIKKLIEEKQDEIVEIHHRTEEDYESAKRVHELLLKSEFSLEEKKKQDIIKVEKEIKNLQGLYDKMNSGKHKIMTVPHFIQLELREKH